MKALVLCLLACASSGATADRLEGRWLITASIVEARTAEGSAPPEDGLPPVYLATLSDVRVVQGRAPDFPQTLEIEIRANNIDYAMHHGRAFFLLDIIDGTVTVRYWESVVGIVCIPEDLVPEEHRERYFREEWNAPDQMCTFGDRYQPTE